MNKGQESLLKTPPHDVDDSEPLEAVREVIVVVAVQKALGAVPEKIIAKC